MTDQELKDLVASLAVQSAKTDAQFAKNAAEAATRSAKNAAEAADRSAEFDAIFKKNDAQFAKNAAEAAARSAEFDAIFKKNNAEAADRSAELDAQYAKNAAEAAVRSAELDAIFKKNAAEFANTEKVLKELGIFAEGTNKKVEGISRTTGEIAQEFFYSSLDKNKTLGGIKFDYIDANLHNSKKGQSHEVDIFLENSNSVGIVEVKSKVRKDDIEQLKNIVAKFYQFHPNFKSYKIIPALAGKAFPKALQNQALKEGFIVLTQQGDHIEQRLP